MHKLKYNNAVLILEDGVFFWGYRYGIKGTAYGEIVFSTSMTGYQETLTDPSYASQLIVQTTPHIGITGINNQDNESSRMWPSGYIIREPARLYSNWRSEESLLNRLIYENIICISGVDTRAITRHIRNKGTMKAGIFSDNNIFTNSINKLTKKVSNIKNYNNKFLIDRVTTKYPYSIYANKKKSKKLKVVIVDLGLKKSVISNFIKRGIDLHVLPANSSIENIILLNPNGVFFSSGPGDPSLAIQQIKLLREVLRIRIPFFGVCLGNQILGHALGFSTYKLNYGHRGINQPVLDKETGSIHITSHNHGYAVKMPLSGSVQSPISEFGTVKASHINLNDQVVEGLSCLDIPAFSVQYHPEAAAGPHDSSYLFDYFINLMLSESTIKER